MTRANEGVHISGGQKFCAGVADEELCGRGPAAVHERGGLEGVEIQLGVVEGEERQDGVQELVGKRHDCHRLRVGPCHTIHLARVGWPGQR